MNRRGPNKHPAKTHSTTGFQCDCGLLLRGSTQYRQHRRSAIHAFGPRIRRLLEHDCVSFAEIGRRLRISRERVRQIAVRLGVGSGRRRQQSCRIARHIADNPRVRELQSLARQWGLRFEAAARQTKSGMAWPAKEIRLNGFRCRLHSCPTTPKGNVCLDPPRRTDYSFFLGKSPFGWLVIPRAQMPKKHTEFVLGRERRLPGGKKKRHDWLTFLDAWHLLAPPA